MEHTTNWEDKERDAFFKEFGINDGGDNVDIDDMERYLFKRYADYWVERMKLLLSKRDAEIRAQDAQIVRDHRLSDWSGEAEVEAELEEIAKKIESKLDTQTK